MGVGLPRRWPDALPPCPSRTHSWRRRRLARSKLRAYGTGGGGAGGQRPPTPPPPPPPPENPPPPLPELEPGGRDAEAMTELRLVPTERLNRDRSLTAPPWYQVIEAVAAAAAAAPAARVNFFVQASSTSSATA